MDNIGTDCFVDTAEKVSAEEFAYTGAETLHLSPRTLLTFILLGAVFLLLFVAAFVAVGQTPGTGAVAGVVLDPPSAAVPNSQVTVALWPYGRGAWRGCQCSTRHFSWLR